MKQAMRTSLSRQLPLHGKKRLRNCRPSTYIWFIAGLIFFFSVQPLWWQARILSASTNKGAFITDHPHLERHNTISTFHPRPRILQLDPEMNKVDIIESQISPKLEPPAEIYKLSKDDNDNQNSNQVCQPMHDWQTKTYPVCNYLHEINVQPETGSLHFINCKNFLTFLSIEWKWNQIIIATYILFLFFWPWFLSIRWRKSLCI